MAWTAVSIERHPELSNRKSQQEFLDEELRCNAYEVEQSKIVKGNYYALVKDKRYDSDNRKFIMVAMFNFDYDDFRYNFFDECCRPVVYDCPARMIQQTDEPMNDAAKQWRQDCAGRRKQQRLLRHAREHHQAIIVHWVDGNDYRCEYRTDNRAWFCKANDGHYDRIETSRILGNDFDIVA